MVVLAVSNPDRQFQSTPDLVNRENSPDAAELIAKHPFQSTPDLVNRENTAQARQQKKRQEFQSTPDLVNRENFLF